MAGRSSSCLISLLLLAWSGNAGAGSAPAITARQIAAPGIKLDGRLDEPEWRDAAPVRLTQQSPRAGGATPYATEVRILVARDRVYFGFTCHDPHPENIAVHSMQRDPDLNGDDFIGIVLDTYG